MRLQVLYWLMFSDEEIGDAAVQSVWDLHKLDIAITDPLWIQMYIDNLREDCQCLECLPSAIEDTT